MTRQVPPSPTMTPVPEHLGWHMIRAIHRYLQIDDKWTQWHDDGFTWWAFQLAQRFRFEGPHEVESTPTWWISFETDFLRNVQDEAQAMLFASEQNRTINLFTAHAGANRLSYRARVYALPDTADHRLRTLADRAILANAIAHLQATALLETETGFKADIDVSHHPDRNARTEPDDMLNVYSLFQQKGNEPLSDERRPDLDHIVRTLDMLGIPVQGGNAAAGVLATLLQLEGRLAFRIDLPVSNPHVGNGMLALLTFDPPDELTYAEATMLASSLNDAEWTTHHPLESLGAWTVDFRNDPHLRLTHATFYPNATLVSTLSPTVALAELSRAVWLQRYMAMTPSERARK